MIYDGSSRKYPCAFLVKRISYFACDNQTYSFRPARQASRTTLHSQEQRIGDCSRSVHEENRIERSRGDRQAGKFCIRREWDRRRRTGHIVGIAAGIQKQDREYREENCDHNVWPERIIPHQSVSITYLPWSVSFARTLEYRPFVNGAG